MIAEAMPSVAETMMGDITLGRMWRSTRRWDGVPIERAASTNSRSFSASTSPRTIRAVCIHEVAPIAVTIRRKIPPSGPKPFDSGSRNSVTINSSKGSSGSARNRSVSRIRCPSRRLK